MIRSHILFMYFVRIIEKNTEIISPYQIKRVIFYNPDEILLCDAE